MEWGVEMYHSTVRTWIWTSFLDDNVSVFHLVQCTDSIKLVVLFSNEADFL